MVDASTIKPAGIGNREVHLWHVDPEQIRGDDLVARCRAVMSAEESARQERFVFEKDRHIHLVAPQV